jgi:hypothetical protein
MESKEKSMDKKLWLKGAAGLSFFMAICQTIISLSPAAAAYFQAPPGLLENRLQLFLIGEGTALILVIFGLYALSGAGRFPRMPLLRLGLIGISSLFLLRGLFFILTVLTLLGVLKGEILIQGEISTLVFLAAGIAYAVGTVLNWKEMQIRRKIFSLRPTQLAIDKGESARFLTVFSTSAESFSQAKSTSRTPCG